MLTLRKLWIKNAPPFASLLISVAFPHWKEQSLNLEESLVENRLLNRTPFQPAEVSIAVKWIVSFANA
jgi:hypothetical protein